ncbi:Ltp family lipoprotein [Aeromicrobium sp. CF4.19]|uniref:Ltp family lipoprotein n=1 Tax=Aeromicrobium sp. CF4.19 TaxID=3373082 RepID=UPI003EE7DCD9
MTDQKTPPGYYPDNAGTMRWFDGTQWTEHTQAAEATGTVVQETPAAYYPDNTGTMRWFDGTQWTEHTQSSAATATGTTQTERAWFKKKRFIIPGALVALIIFGAALSGGADDSAPVASPDTSSSDESDAAVEEEPEPEPEPEEPSMTSGQENALKAGENYLSFAPFSYKGLIRQLSSDAGDGYSVEDATFAADNVGADWKEQAAKAAENYLDISPFSRAGMIQQLSSDAGDGYTQEEAEYGATQAGL